MDNVHIVDRFEGPSAIQEGDVNLFNRVGGVCVPFYAFGSLSGSNALAALPVT